MVGSEVTFGRSAGTGSKAERTRAQKAILQLIEQNLRNPDFGVRDLADAIGVSTRHVQALMAEMALTPCNFIKHRRLMLAARQLAEEGPDCSITDLAYNVGFNDLSNFCRSFRRAFGVTASEYRAGSRARQRQSLPC